MSSKFVFVPSRMGTVWNKNNKLFVAEMLTQFKNGFYKRERFTRSRFHHYVYVFGVLNWKIVFVLFMVFGQYITKIYFFGEVLSKRLTMFVTQSS